jgi:ABC-type multidrug transport system ATPase subunit
MAGISRIEVQSVTRLFGANIALRSVDVDFAPGPITFVQGPNGAGKSTLMSIVGTILKPSKGKVIYAPYGGSRELARRHIGWVAHDSHCYAELTGRENVELAARLYGLDPKPAWQQVCARVQAQRFGDQAVGTLSRGQRQRIALARALVHTPSVLLLDEPLTGLDHASVERMETILVEERERGTIVIVISHTQGMAERMQGRRIYMQQGRIARIEEP